MPAYCFINKQFVPLEEAKIGVMTHAIHYGTALFEGIRGNWNADKKQIFLFRAKEHYQRLTDGSRLLQMDLPFSIDEMCQITVDLIKRGGFREDVYIRPLAYKSSQALGVRLHNLDCDFLVFAIPWGPYLDMEVAKCGVSSWVRPADNVIPPGTKTTGLYINNALAKTESIANGFDEAIMLAPDGHVSEGSGENIFLVMKGKLVTPATYSSILNGITRDTVITLARNELGIEVVERLIDRAELYIADEAFFCGSSAEATPILSVDNSCSGPPGPRRSFRR